MDDVVMAQTLRGGGVHALANVLERYERELFDYGLTLLDDPDQVAQALRDASLAAAGLAARLADPRLVRPWLYALVRNEALRRRDRPAGEAAEASPPPVPEPAAEPDEYEVGADGDARPVSGTGTHGAHATTDVGGHGPRALLADAPHSGRTADEVLREVSDLAHRQLMNDAEIGHVLGIGERRAQRLRSKADAALAESGGVLVPPRVTPRPAAPPDLRERILAAAATPGRIAQRAEIAQPLRRSGFPVPLDRIAVRRFQSTGKSAAMVAAGLAVLALIAFAVSSSPITVIRLSGGPSSAGPSAAGPPPGGPAPSAPASPSPSGPVSPSGSAPPTSGAVPVPSQSPGASVPASPSPDPKPHPTPDPRPTAGAPANASAVTGPSGKCLDVARRGTADGTPITLVTCNGTIAQRWTRGANGTLQALGKCLDFEQPHGYDPQRAVLWHCDGTPSQRWVAAGGLLISRANNLCLEVAPGKFQDLSPARIGECKGGSNQRWTLPS